MELELFRHDVMQTGTCGRGTMAILPMEEKKTQKVALGDYNGVIQAFSVKKGEIASSFKTLPTPQQKITSLTLGKGRQQRDRIFVASGSMVKGLSRKGKEFFRFDTSITESIRKVSVHDKLIWTSAEYVHNQFVEGKDKAFYLAPDRINDAEVVPLISKDDWSPVLACQDHQIRVMTGPNVFYQVATAGAPVSVRYVTESHDPGHRFPNARELLYGTDSGALVQLLMESENARQGMVLPNTKKLGAIRAIYSGLDFSKTGTNDIVVGREDGVLELYDVDEHGAMQQVFSARLVESINTIDGGYVTSSVQPDLLVHTFTGKVLTFSPPGGGLLLPEGDKRLHVNTSEDEARRLAYDAQIQRLKTEVQALKGDVEKEKTRFAERGGSGAHLALSAPFTLQDVCRLEPEEACYVLQLESSVPIFTVAIQADLSLQLLDVPSNVAILSNSPPDEANGNLTLATYRCQDATSRLHVKFKVQEGTSGVLQAFVIPSITPKTCVAVSHKIKPLCLHRRLPEADTSRPTNQVHITGNFGLADMHSWVGRLLPDLPPLAQGAEEVSCAFTNALLGTQLICRYSAGDAHFSSDLITTLGIIHAAVMREATAAKLRVDAAFNPNTAALRQSIALVWPQLAKQRQLRHDFHLLEGLSELKMQDPEVVNFLPSEYSQILERAQAIRTEYKEQPQHLDHLTSLIKNLYQDFCKLAGIPAARQRLPALEQLLSDPRSCLDQVMEFLVGKG
ncbi:bardet-biedl syndrome 7 protein [Haematococcus lacustris]